MQRLRSSATFRRVLGDAENEVAPRETVEATHTCTSRRGRCLAASSPAADVVFTILMFEILGRSSPEFGWTEFGWTFHMPLMLCWLRQAWLAVLVGVALWRGRLSDAPPWAETLESLLSEAFGYVIALLLAAPCVVRLVSEQPASVTDADAPWFWVAIIFGVVCTAAESYFTLAVLQDVYHWSRRRRERRSVNGSSAQVELLTSENADGSTATTSSENAGGSNAAASSSSTPDDKDKSKRPTIKKLLRLVIPDWPLVIQASVFLVLAAVMEALIPHYIGEVCSSIITAEERGTLAQKPYQGPVVRLLLAGAGCGFFSSTRGATFIWIGARVSVRLRQDLFDVLTHQEIGFFDTTKTGDLTSRMTQDCQKITDQVTLNVNVFLRTLVTLVTTLFFMFLVSPPLTMVAFVSVPAVVVISKKYGNFQRKLSEATQKALADANAVASDVLSAMPTVRMFAAERLESARFAHKLRTFLKLQLRQARYYIMYLTLTISLPNFTVGLVLCYGGKLTMHGQIKSSTLLAFVFYLQTLNSSFSTLGDFYSSMVQALGAASKVFELREREAKLPLEPPDGEAVDGSAGDGMGELQLVDIHFTYPARPDVKVLQGLNLTIPAGETVALVGPSGNGKSTVIGLIKRLYKAEKGQVLLNGIDVWSFPHEDFHRKISIVGQEPVLFARSIRKNITYGLENPKETIDSGVANFIRQISGGHRAASDSEENVVEEADVKEATRTANAHDFISEMPEGYDTEVGERGVQLSGGQKQRIAIARALVRDPKVLLLDEATSALDTTSEQQVQQAIDSMMDSGQMTVIVIAHRLSTVRKSHKICVVKQGIVVEEGTHKRLVEAKGEYFNLVENQLSGHTGAADQSEEAPAS